MEFQHKNITNPTVTPADKIMRAISSCIHTIQGLPEFKSNNDLQQLHSVLQEATHNSDKLTDLIQQSKQFNQQPLPRVDKSSQPPPRVDSRLHEDQRITRSTTKLITTASLPVQIHSSLPPPARKKKRRKPTPVPSLAPSTAPAMNTRAKTAAKLQ